MRHFLLKENRFALGTSQKKLLFPSRSFWGPSDDWWTLGDERTR
jgi:hypothetical protein